MSTFGGLEQVLIPHSRLWCLSLAQSLKDTMLWTTSRLFQYEGTFVFELQFYYAESRHKLFVYRLEYPSGSHNIMNDTYKGSTNFQVPHCAKQYD